MSGAKSQESVHQNATNQPTTHEGRHAGGSIFTSYNVVLTDRQKPDNVITHKVTLIVGNMRYRSEYTES